MGFGVLELAGFVVFSLAVWACRSCLGLVAVAAAAAAAAANGRYLIAVGLL